MERKDTTVSATQMHVNDALQLSILARHHTTSATEREKIFKSFKSDSTRRIAEALVVTVAGHPLRAWAIQNAFCKR